MTKILVFPLGLVLGASIMRAVMLHNPYAVGVAVIDIAALAAVAIAHHRNLMRQQREG